MSSQSNYINSRPERYWTVYGHEAETLVLDEDKSLPRDIYGYHVTMSQSSTSPLNQLETSNRIFYIYNIQ